MDNLTLQDPVTPQDGLTLYDQIEQPNPVQGLVASNRAVKNHVALGDASPGVDALEHNILTGQEDYVRRVAATEMDQQKQNSFLERVRAAAMSDNLTSEQAQALVTEKRNTPPTNPSTSLEAGFADKFLNMVTTHSTDPQDPIPAAMAQDPDGTTQDVIGVAHVVAGREILQRGLEDATAKYDKQGTMEWLWNTAKTVVPGVSGLVKAPDYNPFNIMFPGNSIDAERMHFWAIQDLSAQKAWYTGRLEQIAANNPNIAVEWAAKMLTLSSTDKIMDNMMGSLDTQMAGGAITAIGKTAATVAITRQLARKALKDGIAPLERGTVEADKVFDGLGDLKKAAELKATREIFRQADPLGLARDIRDYLPTHMNLDIMFAGQNAGSLSRERTMSLLSNLKATSADMMNTVLKVPRPERLEQSAFPQILKDTAELVRLQRPSTSDSILDTREWYSKNINARYAEVIVGDRDGTLFRTPAAAQRHADELGLPFESYALRNDSPDNVFAKSNATLAQQALAKKTNPNELKRIKESAGSGEALQYPSYAKYLEATEAAGLKEHALSPADFLTKRKEELAKYVESPVQPLMAKVYKNSGAPYASNYYGPGEKGVWFKDKTGKEKFMDMGGHTVAPPTAQSEEFITKGAGNAASTSPNQQKLNSIVQQGNRWYISIVKPFNETADGVRDLLTTTTNTNPLSLANYWLGGLFRSAEDQLAYFQRGNRHISLHAPQEVQYQLKQYAQEIGTMPKDAHERLERVLIMNRDFVDYQTNERGRAYRSQAQFEKAYLDANKVLPTDQETLAYWRYHQLMDMDWVMRNFGVHRDLARQGVELYKVPVKFGGEDKGISFPGRFEKELPVKSKDDFGILDTSGEVPRHVWFNKLNPVEKAALLERIKAEGLQVIQVANPRDRPFSGAAAGVNQETNYVLTKTHENKPLPMRLVDYNPGVHVNYPQQLFTKQPVVEHDGGLKEQLVHFGDKTIATHATEEKAIQFSSSLNELRLMMAKGVLDNPTLNAFIEKRLPKDADFWKTQFGLGEKETGKTYLSLEHPIGHTFSGKDFYDTPGHVRPDGMRSVKATEHDLFRAIDMDFLANRDGPLNTVTNAGTLEKPIYTFEPARVLDPFVSINRGLNNAIRNLYLNDYKTGAIEQWVAQFSKLMKDPAKAKNNPYETFYSKPLNTASMDREGLAAANNTWDRITNFLGTRSELGKDLNLAQIRMMNRIGEENATKYLFKELPSVFQKPLEFIKDPISYTRAAMFDMRFGFFNFGQFIVQGVGSVHSLAVAGPEAWERGMAGYVLQRWMARTEEPAILNRMANIATKFGWEKEHFIESYRAMRNSGVDIIGKEHALRDEAWDPALFTSKYQTFLDWGRYPFTEGERLTRMVSWNTAYHEWRKANPEAILDNFAMGKIMNRFDDLSSNMTKASNSALQEGWASIPTQFLTFSHRMMEQFWGGRLTNAEKARAFITHGALFGLPVAASIPTFYPAYELVRQSLMDRGSGFGEVSAPSKFDSHVGKIAIDGFLSYITYHVTGKDFNIPGRYGPGAPELVKKALGGDLSVLEAVGGPTGTFVQNMMKTTYPFYAHIHAALTGGQDQFPLTKSDIYSVLREASGPNNIHNAFYAMNTGKYLSKYDSFVADGLDWKDGVGMLMGLMPQKVTDARLLIGTLKDQTDAQKKLEPLAERELKRAFEAFGNQDEAKGDLYLARAKVYMSVLGDMSPARINEITKRASTDNQDLVNKIQWKFTQSGNYSQWPARLQKLIEQNKDK